MTIQPITPENCHLLPPYELMIWSLDQVIAQGEMSSSGSACYYRSPRSTRKVNRCAVGHCIPDRDYTAEIEGSSVGNTFFAGVSSDSHQQLSLRMLDRTIGRRFSRDQLAVLRFCQRVHDGAANFHYFSETVRNIKALPKEPLTARILARAVISTDACDTLISEIKAQ